MRGPVFGLVHSFMVWNLFLAMIPVLLALLLFRPQARRGPGWWAGVGAWVLFLPNAPYVLTDVVHMIDDVQAARASNLRAYATLAVYGAFFAAGLVGYVVALGRLERYLGPLWRPRKIAATLLGLHALSAVAMYLGRFVRVNSWDVVVDPGGMAAWSNHLTQRFAVATIVFMFGGLTVAWFATRAVVVEVVVDGKRVARRIGLLR